ncbi:MAG: DedA family protein [Planctomycetota bacterium]|jgi:membrane protein DedA with SNARE-associated domain
MEGALGYLIDNPSYLLILGGLVAAGLGVPITEDVYLLASGVLAERDVVSLPAIFAICVFGVIVGDILIFTIARRLGRAAYDRPLFARLMPPERRERIEALIDRRGGIIVFGARFVAGVRMPVFAIAAVHGMGLARFLAWDLAALVFSAPLVFGLGYFFSGEVVAVAAGLGSARNWILIGALSVVAAVMFGYAIARFLRGRRLARAEGEGDA